MWVITIVKNSMFDLISNDLEHLEDELITVTKSQEELIREISSHLVQAGGKRLRPALYFLSARSGGCHEMAEMMPMAAALELIHMATLVHDDVVDHAETRRGIATANALWGGHSSVLTGDYLFARAFSLIANTVDSARLGVLAELICAMSEGEINQSASAYDANQTEEEYLVRIAQKTADFIAASCKLGAMSARMSPTAVDDFREYGYCLGMAFQITDDILDMTATSEQLGKPAGHDLRQGMITMPVIYALQQSLAKDELVQIVTDRAMSDAKAERGLTIIRESGALEYSYKKVDEYLEKARHILAAHVPQEFQEAFQEIADFVAKREY